MLPDEFKQNTCSYKSKRCTCKKLCPRCGIFCKVCKGRDCQNIEKTLSVPMELHISLMTPEEVEAPEYMCDTYIYKPGICSIEDENDD